VESVSVAFTGDMQVVQHRLSNGLRVVVEVMSSVPSVACGFLVRTGSRDEPAELAGVSHFLEHMCFKGTAHRSWHDISIAFDEMGAQYNAYTTKDRTFYYGWVRPVDLERQIELLADMMRPSLPLDQFDIEKNVVLEELAMAHDDLPSVAYDFLYEHLCPGSALAWPVLGRTEALTSMTREVMADYLRRRYVPGNIVLIVAGRVDPDRVCAMAERYCGDWEGPDPAADRAPPELQRGTATRVVERFHQQALLLAFPAAAAAHSDRETAEAVAAILGGVNSRFYWNIVQEGLCHRAGAFYEDYADFGLVVMYALCEPDRADATLQAIRREAETLTCEGPRPGEIQRVKNLRRTGLASESEAPFHRLGQLADDIEYHGRPRSPAERLAEVDAVSPARIQDYLQRFPITGEGMLVCVGPRGPIGQTF